jgi:phenylalanine-4-hydroxylase
MQQSKIIAPIRRYIEPFQNKASTMLAQRLDQKVTDKGYVPVYATGVVAQDWAQYTDTDHTVWAQLYARQREVLQGRACDEFLQAMAQLEMGPRQIPRFADLDAHLQSATGWRLVAVEGLLPDEVFFGHLAAREFPVTRWIRSPEQLDYLAEPDLFHDLFGHVPLLMNPIFADYMCAYGQGGLKALALGPRALQQLARLYWYTVEFGLINTRAGLRIYGSGILSSAGESRHCLESTAPNRIGFSLERLMRTRYRIDSFQKTYFVTDSFQQLFDATLAEFKPIYARLADQSDLAAGDVRAEDHVLQHGTGEGWATSADT